MSPVLVTGGSGYLGTQLIAALLRDGCQVRATVRSLDREGEVRVAMRRGLARWPSEYRPKRHQDRSRPG
jgi:uncharacterized protein YbjT (DUF2867 family)